MRLRRFPHLRPRGQVEPDPLETLRQLPPGAAQELEQLVRQQSDRERAFVSHQVTESSLSTDLESYVGSCTAQVSNTGGGRQAPAHRPPD